MNDLNFNLALPPIDVRFGNGRVAVLSDVLAGLGANRPLIVTTPAGRARYAGVADALAGLAPAEFAEAAPHCPIEVVERCRQAYGDAAADSVVAVGGGSTLGLGKILAAEAGAIFVAVPTTYSGSEMTPLYGRKIGDEKRVLRDPACRPKIVVFDPLLTLGLPARQVAASGMNSLAHSVEALYARAASPLTGSLASDAMRALRDGLPGMTAQKQDPAAAAQALYGGFLGGLLVAACGIALHHQICHVIGGLFDLAHGDTNAVMLPHAIAYNAPAIGGACAAISAVFGGDSAADGVYDFARKLGAPASLAELGMPAAGIDAVVARMLAHEGWNPRPLERAALLAMVTRAYHGERPRRTGA